MSSCILAANFVVDVGLKVAAREVISALRKRLDPDAALAANYREALDDMIFECYSVVRALIAAHCIVDPSDEDVTAFLENARTDPTFPSRATRLFQEGMKSPSPERRQMLALALFGVPAVTPERDRIDAAIERLFTDDIALLGRLATLEDKHNGYVALLEHDGAEPRLWALSMSEHEKDTVVPDDHDERVECDRHALYSLDCVGCVRLSDPIGLASTAMDQSVSSVGLTPLGRGVIEALRNTRVAAV